MTVAETRHAIEQVDQPAVAKCPPMSPTFLKGRGGLEFAAGGVKESLISGAERRSAREPRGWDLRRTITVLRRSGSAWTTSNNYFDSYDERVP
jgi:hypothetical protein